MFKYKLLIKLYVAIVVCMYICMCYSPVGSMTNTTAVGRCYDTHKHDIWRNITTYCHR